MRRQKEDKKENSSSKEKMLKPKGRAKACFICIVMIILAVTVGGRRTLPKLRNEALDVFFSGDGSSLDLGIEHDLQQRITLAKRLVVVGERYFNENDALLTNVTADCSKISGSNEPNVKYKYNKELTSDCYALVEALDLLQLSKDDENYVVEIMVDMESANQIIGHSSYNEKANDFNKLLEEFPTNIVAKLSFVKPLALFEY